LQKRKKKQIFQVLRFPGFSTLLFFFTARRTVKPGVLQTLICCYRRSTQILTQARRNFLPPNNQRTSGENCVVTSTGNFLKSQHGCQLKNESKNFGPSSNFRGEKSGYTWNLVRGFWLIFFWRWNF
jgi:hypothetical protein